MADGRKVGLCLTGGGITGALYQVGALAALEDATPGLPASDVDVLVGSSSGATVALALAGGSTATRMYRALLDPSDDFFPLTRQHLLKFDADEWKRVGRSALGAARRVLLSATSKPLSLDPWTEIERFTDSLPAGVFTMDAYARFLEDFGRRRGLPRTFRALDRTLLVVAHDLDLGERVVFGEGPLADVALADAVAASSAIPLLFAPVRLDGRDYVDGGLGDVGHVDVAVAHGCTHVVVINPMVPLRNDPAVRDVPTGHGLRERVRDKGLLWVYNQSWRFRSETRFRKLRSAGQ
jgi:predicted acylesterase/phospholipase RssA